MQHKTNFFHKVLTTLRPVEILGLFFCLVMIVLYLWLGLPIYPKSLVLWGIIVLMTFAVIMPIRLFLSQGQYHNVFSKKSILEFIRDWIPLFLFITVYDNLHDVVHLINPYNFDSILIKIDQTLFLGHHPTVLLENIISPALTEWLNFAYVLYFIYFPVTLGVLYFLNKKREFYITGFTVMICIYAGYILYLLFPCVGPILSQHALHTVDLKGGLTFEWYQGTVDLYGAYRDYFHCFPSLHFAVSAVFWFCTWKYVRTLFYIYAPFVLSLWLATIYLRWHYVIDLIAGAILAGYAIFFGPLIYEAWEKWKNKKPIS